MKLKISMDNLNSDWPLDFGTKSLGGWDHRLKSISQIERFGDTSDDLSGVQQFEFLTD